MIERTVTIQNEAGIHCRPSSEILMAVQKFPDCIIHAESKHGKVELNSMLALLGLGLSEGDEVKVSAEGDNEHEACDVVAALFSFNFDFPKNVTS